MTLKDKAMLLMKQNNGYITSKILADNNIPLVILTRLQREGIIEKVRSGIYKDVNLLEDSIYTYSLRYQNLIYSKNTALYLNKLLDRRIYELEANVNQNYNNNLEDKGIKLYRIVDWKLKLGVKKIKTAMGNYVKTYNQERAICDLVINIDNYDLEDWRKIIKKYKNNNPNYNLLEKYATKLKIWSKVKLIIEAVE